MWSAGVFEMSHSGLEAVSNTSGTFLSEQDLDSDIFSLVYLIFICRRTSLAEKYNDSLKF
jgi:predicted ATP-dependent serine protease